MPRIFGSLLAVAVPAFSRDLHASRFVEPTEGLARLGAAAVAYAEANERFPDSAPLTPGARRAGRRRPTRPAPGTAPRGRRSGSGLRAEGVPHAYSFSFESTAGGTAFVAQARGDLDGDGVLSTFEIRGARASARDGEKPTVAPGMYVEAELE